MNLIIFPASACPSSNTVIQLWFSTVHLLVARLLQSAVPDISCDVICFLLGSEAIILHVRGTHHVKGIT